MQSALEMAFTSMATYMTPSEDHKIVTCTSGPGSVAEVDELPLRRVTPDTSEFLTLNRLRKADTQGNIGKPENDEQRRVTDLDGQRVSAHPSPAGDIPVPHVHFAAWIGERQNFKEREIVEGARGSSAGAHPRLVRLLAVLILG